MFFVYSGIGSRLNNKAIELLWVLGKTTPAM